MAFDPMEAVRRAKEAAERATRQMNESIASAQEAVRRQEDHMAKQKEQTAEREAEEQQSNVQRQVEIMGQLFGGQEAEQATAAQEQLQAAIEEQVAHYASMEAQQMMNQLFGEDMAMLTAAMETLHMDGAETDEDNEMAGEWEEDEIDEADLPALFDWLEKKMEEVASLPEAAPIPYGEDKAAWGTFGILLSGIVSHLNNHELSGMEVEEHLPVLEQQIASVVRRSWGVNGREDLLDTLRYLTQEGYIARYAAFQDAPSAEALFADDMDEEEQENIHRGWLFVQHFKDTFSPGFLLGWDLGRAAMLTRWGFYLGWLTRAEAVGILNDLSRAVSHQMDGWREFGQSYQFGGMFWKLLCGTYDCQSYLGSVTRAITELLTDSDMGGEWKNCPWPLV